MHSASGARATRAQMKGMTIKALWWKYELFRQRVADAGQELGVDVGMETATTTTIRLHMLHDMLRMATLSE